MPLDKGRYVGTRDINVLVDFPFLTPQSRVDMLGDEGRALILAMWSGKVWQGSWIKAWSPPF